MLPFGPGRTCSVRDLAYCNLEYRNDCRGEMGISKDHAQRISVFLLRSRALCAINNMIRYSMRKCDFASDGKMTVSWMSASDEEHNSKGGKG